MVEDRARLLALAAEIRLAVFDVDGVMTDGRISYTSDGSEIKSFHSHDGLGMKALRQNGIEVAVITARQSTIVERRMSELGIAYLLQGRRDKSTALDELLSELRLDETQTAYAGDDLVDWPAMSRCGLKCAPGDAHHRIVERADYRCARPGGAGAVREICELILEGHGKLEAWLESFS
jgi:3-deoxy-D-manno-octulosonate 8-phosphate phosphatase (KDO 8-P phosphatase)